MRVRAELAPCSVNVKSQGKKRTTRLEGAAMAYDVTSRGLVQTAELLSAELPVLPEVGIIVTPDDAFLVSAVGVLPTKPLQTGATWHGTVTLPSVSEPGGVVSAAYDSKVVGRVAYAGRSCWRIATKLRSSREESQSASCGRWNARAKITQTGSKEWLFDPEAGLVMKIDGKDIVVISQGHCVIPSEAVTRAIARGACQAWVRSAAAMLRTPLRRNTPITRLRKAAITWGAAPVRIWQRSSSKVTSRTQWRRFSMPQCPRTRCSSCAGVACWGERLVMR